MTKMHRDEMGVIVTVMDMHGKYTTNTMVLTDPLIHPGKRLLVSKKQDISNDLKETYIL